MATADAGRRGNRAKRATPDRKKRVPEEQPMSDTPESTGKPDQSPAKLLAFTIDPNTAEIVKLESLDANGARHELSDDEKATLVKDANEGSLEEVVEQAFEAGIACVLDAEPGLDTSDESEEDAELRHLLLTPLIERSAAKHLIEREVLNRAILDTLIGSSIKTHATADQGSPTAEAR